MVGVHRSWGYCSSTWKHRSRSENAESFSSPLYKNLSQGPYPVLRPHRPRIFVTKVEPTLQQRQENNTNEESWNFKTGHISTTTQAMHQIRVKSRKSFEVRKEKKLIPVKSGKVSRWEKKKNLLLCRVKKYTTNLLFHRVQKNTQQNIILLCAKIKHTVPNICYALSWWHT